MRTTGPIRGNQHHNEYSTWLKTEKNRVKKRKRNGDEIENNFEKIIGILILFDNVSMLNHASFSS